MCVGALGWPLSRRFWRICRLTEAPTTRIPYWGLVQTIDLAENLIFSIARLVLLIVGPTTVVERIFGVKLRMRQLY